MFLCCDADKDDNKEAVLSSIDHRNPASRIIHAKQTSKKKQRLLTLSRIAPSKGCTHLLPPRPHSPAQPLAKSLLYAEQQTHLLEGTRFTEVTLCSGPRELQVSREMGEVEALRKKTCTLEKYVQALEKNNRHLEVELSKRQERSRDKFTSELRELRDRLRKVDLSRVCQDLATSREKASDSTGPSAPLLGSSAPSF
jgi:hypothetical protein